MASIGVDTGIFKAIADSGNAVTSKELSDRTNVDHVLMKRLLRYYQAFEMIKEIAEDSFTANNVTTTLASPSGQGISYLTKVVQPTYLALPEFLKKTGYKNPTNGMDCPWQLGYKTDQHAFDYVESHPEHFQLFMMWLATNREGLPLWYDIFPFDQVCAQNTTSETVLFVDVGSAFGHQTIALREKFPNLPGRYIIQDREPVIAAAQPPQGIEAVVYDFFTPQPVKGARAYYLRMIIHDHQDEQARQILTNTMSAMTEESVILIDDMIFPEKGTPWRAVNLDITMMTCLAAKERSEKEIYSLLDSVGLGVVKVWKYTEECDDCIIVAKPKKFL